MNDSQDLHSKDKDYRKLMQQDPNNLPSVVEKLEELYTSALYGIKRRLLINLRDEVPLIFTPADLATVAAPPKGFYIRGDVLPIVNFLEHPVVLIVKPGQTLKDATQIQSLDDLRKTDGKLVTATGRVLMDSVARYRPLLTDTTPHPHAAINLLFIAIQRYLEEKVHSVRTTSGSPTKEMLDQFWDEERFEEFEDRLRCKESRLMTEINGFIRDFDMSSYSVGLRGATLVISKGEDYRVVEYYRMKLDQARDQFERAGGSVSVTLA